MHGAKIKKLSVTSLSVPGLFFKVLNHLERLCSVRTNKAVKHVINTEEIHLKNYVLKSS